MAHPDVPYAEEAQGPAELAPTSARWSLGLSTAVSWFLISGLSTAANAVQTGVWLQVQGRPDIPVPAVLFLLPLLAFAAPALPLASWWGRERLATIAALAAFVAGLALAVVSATGLAWQITPFALALMLIAASVTAASGSLFLAAMVGLVNRRAVAGGLIGAFILRDLVSLVRLGGAGMSVRPELLLVVGLLIGSMGAWCLHRWCAAPTEGRGDSFERRAGGLRLRGALALGVLLFFELYGVGARASGVGPLTAALAMTAPALAWLFGVRGFEVPRHRMIAVVLALTATLGVLLPVLASSGAFVTPAHVIAHTAALILLGRALAPVSGRRSGRNLTAGLAFFVLLSIGWMLTLVLFPRQSGVGGASVYAAGWVLIAGAVLTVAMHLTPRPPRADGALPERLAIAIALSIPVMAAIAAAFAPESALSRVE